MLVLVCSSATCKPYAVPHWSGKPHCREKPGLPVPTARERLGPKRHGLQGHPGGAGEPSGSPAPPGPARSTPSRGALAAGERRPAPESMPGRGSPAAPRQLPQPPWTHFVTASRSPRLLEEPTPPTECCPRSPAAGTRSRCPPRSRRLGPRLSRSRRGLFLRLPVPPRPPRRAPARAGRTGPRPPGGVCRGRPGAFVRGRRGALAGLGLLRVGLGVFEPSRTGWRAPAPQLYVEPGPPFSTGAGADICRCCPNPGLFASSFRGERMSRFPT